MLDHLIEVLKKVPKPAWVGLVASLTIALATLAKAQKGAQIKESSLYIFDWLLKRGRIATVVYDGTKVFFRETDQETWESTVVKPLIKPKRLLSLLHKYKVENFEVIGKQYYTVMEAYQYQNAALLLSLGLSILMFGTISQMGKKHLQSMPPTGVTFDSIYGLNSAKQQLKQVIDFLQNGDKFRAVGARLRRGILIHGPPGTGKTMLAKATATESKVKFLYVSATEFIETYVGTGPKRVRELFANARAQAPAIIFIDEIDSVAYKRKNANFGGDQVQDSERISTLNQLLTELDGFTANEDVVVIAATNRIKVLDDAMLRSGRFDIKIKVQLPTEEERIGILKIHLQKKQNDITDLVLEQIAQSTQQFSGADIENITNEAAYLAVSQKAPLITNIHLQEALQKLVSEKQRVQQQQ